MMTELPSLIVFGSLMPWSAQDRLHQLTRELRRTASFEPIVAAIKDVGQLWKCLAESDPALDAVAGKNAANQLVKLFNDRNDEQITYERRNIMMMPITIINQIVQYFNYLEHLDDGKDHSSILESVSTGGGIQGFCAGLLSALAVASGKTKEEAIALAATSVKLAFCIGAYIDLDQAKDDKNFSYTTLAVRWKAPATFDSVQRLLLCYPDTYISVVRDVRDISVTTPTSTVTALLQELSNNGLSVLDTGLSGRYHTDVHQDAVTKILNACHEHFDPRFGDQELVRSNSNSQIIPRDDALRVALQNVLVDHANWHLTISTSVSRLSKVPENPVLLSIGADSIPKSVSGSFPIVKIRTILSKGDGIAVTPTAPSKANSELPTNDIYPENAIAIIGMSCKVPGADSIDEFWDLLTEGKSMLEKLPKERFDANCLTRSRRDFHFWGNFVRDVESFDHKFFKKSAREATSMDPQQRLLLQTAYQALESSGYFSDPSKPRNIGCYIGACATDYDSNVACHPPTAYSTIGTLRAFLSGKISHNFGWSGPSLTFDTACSSSAVAIHTACTALRMEECSQAVAGGIALFTSPYLYENLAAAHFLSPSGATKPFDASADGYCRGEGVGLVVLKKLSNAISNGDNILGVIGGSAVNQNANCVPITVPHSSSQGDLYQKVANQAGITPQEVDFVEAHGTGTPVGDPIEMESIRRVFGGPKRNLPLFVSSVKGNIGHLEGASGVIALIKALLQIEFRTACIQASFKKLNPRIPSLEVDNICIPTSNRPLPGHLLTACINNYGAAGSNAAMILIEAPPKQKLCRHAIDQNLIVTLPKYPIHISAASAASLVKYCQLLDDFCRKSLSSLNDTEKAQMIPNLAFNLAKRQNQALAYMLTMTVADINQFQDELRHRMRISDAIKQRPKELPVVLCFGGQVGEHIALSKNLWQSSSLFRFHLNCCDETLRTMGYPSLYPTIFQSEPVTDIVALQSAIFSTQYSCAHAWLDSGLKVEGLIGHSLGQFAALCVSGMLSLRDGLKLVSERASLMKKYWGSEAGAMIAVEADIRTMEELTHNLTARDRNYTFEVACYNGPTSQVIVGDKISIDQLEADLLKRSIRHRRLKVTHGFHSRFTEPVIPHLETLASTLTFKNAKIPLETCTDETSWPEATPQLVAAHTRNPVFFGQAVQRIRNKLGPCTFLEAGSNSSIVAMVRRALSQSTSASNNFIAMELNKLASLDKLVDTTIELWNCGHQVQFWNFHRLQAPDYNFLRLPSYEFEKQKHWLKLEVPTPKDDGSNESKQGGDIMALTTAPLSMLIPLKSTITQEKQFFIDSRSEEYKTLVKGHILLGQVDCPLSVFVEFASRAVEIVEGKSDWLLSVQTLNIESPLGIAANREINIQLHRLTDSWSFKITSKPKPSNDTSQDTILCHATGVATFQTPNSALITELSHYERLTGHQKISTVLEDPDVTSIKGPMLYKLYSQTVEYDKFYQNVRSLASVGSQAVGKVFLPSQAPDSIIKDSSIQPHILDSFIQVAGFQANCVHDSRDDEVFWLSGIDRVQFGPDFTENRSKTSANLAWDVISFISTNKGDLVSDIFVYDDISKRLVLFVLGARYKSIRRASLVELLCHAGQRAAESMTSQNTTKSVQANVSEQISPLPTQPIPAVRREVEPAKSNAQAKDLRTSIFEEVCVILEKIADVPRTDVKGNSSFEDLGVDSLMMIEVIGEISSFYKADLPVEDLEQLTDFDSLVQYLHGRGCKSSSGHVQVEDSVTSSSSNCASTSSAISTTDSSPITTPSETPSPSEVAGKLSKLVSEHLELETELTLTSNLADHGLDSLLCIELATDIQKMFQVDVDMEKLDETSTFGTLLNMVVRDEIVAMDAETIAPNEGISMSTSALNSSSTDSSFENPARNIQGQDSKLRVAQQIFESLRFDVDKFCEQTGFNGFWKEVYPEQADLVNSYIVEAFRDLGCDMTSLSNGQTLPPIKVLPKHGRLMSQLHKILTESGIIEARSENTYVRTAKCIDPTPAATNFEHMLQKYPQHSSETKLLNVSGSRLAACLLGKTDPLQLLFANRGNRGIMADVYENAPMCQATTRLLATFLAQSFQASKSSKVFQILEVGAGTGGTARYLIAFLMSQGVKFEYTFTDISSSLVSQAKKTFAGQNMMKFMTLDCDRAPPQELLNKFDIVVATNVIHATKNATSSATNIASLLRDEGVFCLVEFTKGLYWFDLVYGLLEGWWYFSDGRQHALADQWWWDNSLKTAGFKHVSWTDGSSSEAQTMRLICGFKNPAEKDLYKPTLGNVFKRAGIPTETFTFKRAGNLELQADVYFPKVADDPAKERPIALMIHGGGHLLFSRQDIPMKHVRTLLQRGFLPVSVDYRLCPELSLFDGPITDCCDALKWAREILPSLKLSGPTVRVEPNKLLALGWSSGGQLAMTLGYTAKLKGVKPPDVILPFYSPSDLEAEFWDEPIYPEAAEEAPTDIWGELDCVREEPILEYTPISNKRATALSLTLKDDRARLILHMNWKAQSVAVLIRGLPPKSKVAADDKTDWKALPKPPVEKVRECSPYWQILQGNYRTPTFMVHGNIDDWIPYQMTQKTVAALQERGVPSGILIPDQCGHAFDLFPKEDRLGVGWTAIEAAYDFACAQLALSS